MASQASMYKNAWTTGDAFKLRETPMCITTKVLLKNSTGVGENSTI